MVSLKKSLMIIFMILYININNPCSAVSSDNNDVSKPETSTVVEENDLEQEYETLQKVINFAHIKEDMQEYKNQCIIGIKSLCTDHQRNCKSISDYADTINELIEYNDIQIPQSKSFVYFVWERVVRNKEKIIQTPGKYCKEYVYKEYSKGEFGITENDCKNIMKEYKFIKNSMFSLTIDTLRSVYFLWSPARINKITDTKIKEIISGYFNHHLKKYDINEDPSLTEGNIPELYCEKKMCLYELDKVFSGNSSWKNLFGSSKINSLTSIKYMYENRTFDDVKFATAKYFVVYLYKLVYFPEDSVPNVPLPYCYMHFWWHECEDQIKWAKLGDSLNEVVKSIYFKWSKPLVKILSNREIISSYGEYLKTLIELLSERCQVSQDNESEHVGYNPLEFCTNTGLAPLPLPSP